MYSHGELLGAPKGTLSTPPTRLHANDKQTSGSEPRQRTGDVDVEVEDAAEREERLEAPYRHPTENPP